MQICTCTVRVGGNLTNVVTNKKVTVPEIVVLKKIHGNDAVLDIVPVDYEEDYNDEAERERLFKTYEAILPEEQRGMIDNLFPGIGTLPRNLKKIGVDPKAEAEARRERAQKELDAADAVESTLKFIDGDDDGEEAAAAPRRRRRAVAVIAE